MEKHIFAYLFIVAVFTYFSVSEPKSFRRFILKILTSGCFVFLAIGFKNQYALNSDYSTYILLATVFSFLGDLFLGLNNVEKLKDKYKIVFYIFGAITFIVAQVFYIYNFAFYSSNKFYWYLLFILPVALLVYYFIIRLLKVTDKGRIIASSIYCISLVCMLISVINFKINCSGNISTVALIAGIIFAISDYSLLFKYFYNGNKKYATIVTTLTYYVAQLLFVITLGLAATI